MSRRHYTLTIACPDRVGIVAATSGLIASHRGWILEASHYADPVTNWFFMRHEILAESLAMSLDEFRRLFAPLASQFDMKWRLTDSAEKKRVAVMVSKQDHCLSDLLHRWRNQEFEFDITCVISNHPDFRGIVEFHRIPYFHVPVTPQTRDQAFGEVESIVRDHKSETIVLARYMQVLPVSLCEKFAGQIINIHHGFLPSFSGANPYRQAYDRGVKLIGATCHYTTAELDAGPIIEQDVIRVAHDDSAQEMAIRGRDIERIVLARGVRWHVQDRVLLHQNKTIVFN